MVRSPPEEILYYNCLLGQLSTTFNISTEVQQWQLLVAVDHRQLRIKASVKIVPINWPLPPPFTGESISVPPTNEESVLPMMPHRLISQQWMMSQIWMMSHENR